MASPELKPSINPVASKMVSDVMEDILRAPVKLSVTELIPDVESHVFEDAPDATFWLGVLATPKVVLMPAERLAATKLRASVYIDEMGFLSRRERQSSGGEADEFDARSVHFGVLENMGEGRAARMVGVSRMILKEDADELLPVEELFAADFKNSPAPKRSFETSRYIARHENRKTQAAVSMALIRAMTAYAVENDHGPAYAIIEKPLARLFKIIRLPFEEVSDFEMVPEYNTVNQAIVMNPNEVMNGVDANAHSGNLARSFFAAGRNGGSVGAFDETFIRSRESE